MALQLFWLHVELLCSPFQSVLIYWSVYSHLTTSMQFRLL